MNKQKKLEKSIEKLAKKRKELEIAVLDYRHLEAQRLASILNIADTEYVFCYQFNDDDGKYMATAMVLANENLQETDWAVIIKGDTYENEALFNEDVLNEISEDNSLFNELTTLFNEEVISDRMANLEDFVIYS